MRFEEDFLHRYNANLALALKKNAKFSAFKTFLKSKSYEAHTKFDYERTYDFLLGIKFVLDKIVSIVNNPHLDSTLEEVIIRSEVATSLSIDNFKDTLKDPKLWKNKDGEMMPEYVHTMEHIDTLVTYENSFITRLIDMLHNDIDEAVTNLYPLVKSIEQQFEARGVTFGKYSLINTLDKKGTPIKEEFLLEKAQNNDAVNLAQKLIKRIKNLETTEFYRFNKKNVINSDIMPTNILIHDPLYASCYRYYVDHYSMIDSTYLFKKNYDYYNYFISLLLAYCEKDISDDLELTFDENNRLLFKPFKYHQGLFVYEISEVSDHLAIKVNVSLMDNKNVIDKAKYYFFSSYKYANPNKEDIDKTYKALLREYDGVSLVCQNNLSDTFNDVLNISIYHDYNFELIKNMFASMSLLFEYSGNVYQHICPVCGSKHPIVDDDVYVCNSCKARYQMYEHQKKNLLWVKSLRRE